MPSLQRGKLAFWTCQSYFFYLKPWRNFAFDGRDVYFAQTLLPRRRVAGGCGFWLTFCVLPLWTLLSFFFLGCLLTLPWLIPLLPPLRLLLQLYHRRSQGFQWEENCKTTLCIIAPNHEDCLCHYTDEQHTLVLTSSMDCPISSVPFFCFLPDLHSVLDSPSRHPSLFLSTSFPPSLFPNSSTSNAANLMCLLFPPSPPFPPPFPHLPFMTYPQASGCNAVTNH